MKVLHLPYGIAMSTICPALRELGVNAKSCSFNSSNYYHYLADLQLNIKSYPTKKRKAIRKKFFKKALKKYDIYHFYFGETFLKNKRDLRILAKHGKKMVVEHRGSDVRKLSMARSFNNPYVRVKPTWTEKKIHNKLKILSNYINHAIVPDYELLPYVKPYYKKVHVVPRAINTRKFIPKYPSSITKPLVVHAPSNKDIKGTKFILSAVERLQSEGVPFEFQLIENLPHKQALQIYQQATIVIDQLLIGSYANLSMEAMAMGKPVICYIRDDLLNKYPSELPIVNANPETIDDALKNLLKQPNQWKKIGMEGRRYVETYHSPETAALAVLNIYKKL